MEQPNQSYIDKLSGGDDVFKQKLIGVIKREFPQEKQLYLSNLSLKKYELVADNVHKLKHKISILGLEKSYETSVLYEKALLEGDAALQGEFKVILDTITNYLKTL